MSHQKNRDSSITIDDHEALENAQAEVNTRNEMEFYENFTLVGRFSEELGESEETMKELTELIEKNGIAARLMKKQITSKLKGSHLEFEIYAKKDGAHKAAEIIDKLYQ